MGGGDKGHINMLMPNSEDQKAQRHGLTTMTRVPSNLNELYSHTEVTENTQWHTAARLSTRMTSASQTGRDEFTPQVKVKQLTAKIAEKLNI